MKAKVEFSKYRDLIRKDQGQREKTGNEVCQYQFDGQTKQV